MHCCTVLEFGLHNGDLVDVWIGVICTLSGPVDSRTTVGTPPIILPPPHCPPPPRLGCLPSIIMSASPPSPPRKRSNISQACRNCRHRKKKCDGQKPVCRTCQAYKVRADRRIEESDPRTTAYGTRRPTGVRTSLDPRPTLSAPASPNWSRNCGNLGRDHRLPSPPLPSPGKQIQRCGTHSWTLLLPPVFNLLLRTMQPPYRPQVCPPCRLSAQPPFPLRPTRPPPLQRLGYLRRT